MKLTWLDISIVLLYLGIDGNDRMGAAEKSEAK